jgi:hypothetical protein|tara:strand:+ start:251 stop:556 length:306 start_codon:yes stop_codon:yes gene_type:complete
MHDQITYGKDGNATSFNGRGAVNVYAMAVIASGLTFYVKTGMRLNRAYTPTAMMKAGRMYLGESANGIKARDYTGMADALQYRVEKEKRRIAALNSPAEAT